MKQVHERLRRVTAEVVDWKHEAQTLKAEQPRESAWRAQLRAQLATCKRDAQQRRGVLSSHISSALCDYRERVQSVLETLHHVEDCEARLAVARVQLKSIGSAMLDDCDNATARC